MSKSVFADQNAVKELGRLPAIVQAKLEAIIHVLSRDGRLVEPYGKKLTRELYEIRLRTHGQWRVLYAYLPQNQIVILHVFQKKTQKTPITDSQLAHHRLRRYV